MVTAERRSVDERVQKIIELKNKVSLKLLPPSYMLYSFRYLFILFFQIFIYIFFF